MTKIKPSRVLSAVMVLTLIIVVTLVIYMKSTNNCGLLGKGFQSLVGNIICSAEAATPQGMIIPTSPPPIIPVENSTTDAGASGVGAPVIPGMENNTTAPTVALPPQEIPTLEQQPPADAASTPQLIGGNSQATATEMGDVATPVDMSGTTLASSPGAPGTPATPGTLPPPPPAYETPALLVADNKLRITSLIPGKIRSIAYKEGQEFKKDDILVTFDCKNIELDLDIQKAELKDKEESLKDLTKLKELKSTSEYSIVRAQSQVAQTKKLIEKYEYQLTTCIIKAEYSGKIISKQANENQYVQAGQEILTVNNNTELLVKAYIPVTWLEWLKPGTTFELCFNKNSCHKGVVSRLGAEVDAISQTLDIFGKLTSEDTSSLIAGLSGQVKFDKS